MRILVTNDDGIHAPGLKVMENIARTLSDDVWIVAPEVEQSGASHSLSIRSPLRFHELAPQRYAVSGTPTDCVITALRAIIPEQIDLVLSGVNRGPNVADDVTHSGTVAAAMEGALCGVRSIAFSLALDFESPSPQVRWETAETFAPDVIRRLMAQPLSHDLLYNVNFPDCTPDKVKGVKCVAQGKHKLDKALTRVQDPDGRAFYWVHWADRGAHERRPDVDIHWLAEDYVTVTPLCLDLTHYATLSSLKHAMES